jgi:protoheme IX farnesyltransferase
MPHNNEPQQQVSTTSSVDIKTESEVSDFFALLKPRVMSLVVFIGFAGYWIAPDRASLHPFLALMGILSLALGAGASGAFNMWYERDIDSIMKRTQNRPLPLGKIAPDDALGFAIFMSILAVMMMTLSTNWVAASVLAVASLFYIFVYTVWLKRRTPQNIVIGGAAGAFPPMVGYAMVTGTVSLESIILFLIVFLWTPPHFWALALFANEDYKRANIPMMPVIAGEASTKKQMLAYTLILFPVAMAPYFMGFAGVLYGAVAGLLGLFFIFTSIRVLRDETYKSAKLMFGFSVFYLFALFLALMLDHI